MQNIARDTVIDERYRVVDRVGSGGMADVYLVSDLQLHRKVALKLLSLRFAEDSEFVERFRREASSAAGLQHANVVSIFDRGEWEGTYYIAMEYLEGRSLKQISQEAGPLDPRRAAYLIGQVLEAARFAHRRGIVHRDFKPHNVIVDDEDQAKVTDFGIARAGSSDMTETGSIMGTAQYLSPEQAQGHAVSAQSDLYSIGIMLYELLCAQVPFDGDSPVTVALKQVSDEPEPPSRRNPAVSSALDAVVMRALQKDPRMRFADAGEFAGALAAAVDGVALREPAPATGAYAAVPVAAPVEPEADGGGRGRNVAAVLFVLAILAGAGIIAYLQFAPKPVDVPDVVGNRADTAAARLQNAGFGVNIQRARSETAPAERVFRQDPSPDEEADEGATVTILVSDGPADGTIPSVEGLTERSARRRVEAAGFRVRVRREESDTVAAGRVVESSPDGRARLQRGRTVELVVSNGPRQVEVPRVVGRTTEEASSELEAAGFELTIDERESADEEPGTVLAQRPTAGRAADQGSTVRLVVAREPRTLAVPDVRGQRREDAERALAQAGFGVRTRTQATADAGEVGRVIDQDPSPESERRRGATVFITVGSRPSPAGTPTPQPTPTPGQTPTPVPPAATP